MFVRMRRVCTTALLLFGLLLPTGKAVHAQTRVSIELVLAVDTSLSVNDLEFALQMHGIAEAFRSREVMDLIVSGRGVAVTIMQWAGWVREEHSVPWRLLRDRASILSFAAEVSAAKRQGVGYMTAVGTAIGAALHELQTNDYAGELLKIDLSGDGYSNAGPELIPLRNHADTLGVTINGLAILTDFDDLDDYFRAQVVVGPGAFVIEAADYDAFAHAMKLKLLRELAPQISQLEETASPVQAARLSNPAVPTAFTVLPRP